MKGSFYKLWVFVTVLWAAIGLFACKNSSSDNLPAKFLTEGIAYRHISESEMCSNGGHFKVSASHAFGGGFEMIFKKHKRCATAVINIDDRDTLFDPIRVGCGALKGTDSVITGFEDMLIMYRPDSTNYMSFDGIYYYVEMCQMDSSRSIIFSMPGKYPDTPNRNKILDEFARLLSKVDVENEKARSVLQYYRNEALKN